jgi:mannose-1-phosphate guanylyltransferase
MGSSNAAVWGVVLAGGDGTRLLPLTRHIAGHDCPKQFCAVTGGRTLLGQTLDRIAPFISAERTVVVATRAYAAYLGRDLPGTVPPALLQPANRGTAPAILWAAHRVSRLAPEAIMAVFPSDHFVCPDRKFMAHVSRAAQVVYERPELVVLLGIDPDGPEQDYGWIEPGEPVPGRGCALVRRFWEKPTAELAGLFFDAGFLWNTMVIVARADALTALGSRHVPDVAECLETLESHAGGQDDPMAVSEAYAWMRSSNFSREVLEREAASLAVLRIGDVLWSDWGTPDRVIRTLRNIGVFPAWLRTWPAQSEQPCSGSAADRLTGSQTAIGAPMAFATSSDPR